MLASLRSRLNSFRGGNKLQDENSNVAEPAVKPNRNEYTRPAFLKLNEDELRASDNHETRPIVTPKSPSALPWNAGYAECVCARVKKNEDQTAVGEIKLDHQLTPQQQADHSHLKQVTEASLRGIFFGVFDGHGGSGASLMVADQLINHLQEKLVEVQKDLFDLALRERRQRTESMTEGSGDCNDSDSRNDCMLEGDITFDDLIIGALESAFHAMDEHIEGEKASFNITGGCCTLVALFLFGKLFIANAGDCRAVAYIGDMVMPLSTDFTADQDSERIYTLAKCCPELTKGLYSINQFQRPLMKDDIGQRVLCKMHSMAGWSYKEVARTDVCFPLVFGRRKGSRLMNCIGISRSLGDHDLKDGYTSLSIKPFLSCTPEVQILDLHENCVTDMDFLVLGSDGLWDNISNDNMGQLVRSALQTADTGSHRYKDAAHSIVRQARGTREHDAKPGWRTAEGDEASYDDITALVVPLKDATHFTSLTFLPTPTSKS